MDLHQQMLWAWLRPSGLAHLGNGALPPGLPTPGIPIPDSSMSSSNSSSMESASSSASLPPSALNLRQLLPPPASSAPVIRRVSSSTPLAVFDPRHLASPALPIEGLFPPPPPQALDAAALAAQLPQAQLDQLMAVALQQMVERIRAADVAKLGAMAQLGATMAQQQQQFGQLQQQQQQALPPSPHSPLIGHHFPGQCHGSAFSTVVPSSHKHQSEAMKPASSLDEASKPIMAKSEPKTSPASPPPPAICPHFVPSPSTSADELLGEALARLCQQWDGESRAGENGTMGGNGKSANNGNGNGTTAQTTGGEAGSEGSSGPSNGGDFLPNGGDGTNNGAIEEFLLCKVCSDKASGFHYGIFSCEGCKGFFRRSLQNKIDYRPCTQSQKCQIVRANRNRCQECRWRKCIEAGMSKDGVRYGRVPKREKEKMREEMRRDSVRTQLEQLALELGEEGAGSSRTMERLERGWAELGHELASALLAMERQREEAIVAQPEGLVDASQLCALAKAVVRFAGRIGGFRLLRRTDRVQLIKEAFLPVLLLRFCSLRHAAAMDDQHQSLLQLCAIPWALQLPPPGDGQQNGQAIGALRDCSMEFVHRLRHAQPPAELALSDCQLAICAALCLCRLDGAVESASGGGSASQQAWEEQSGQLGHVLCRRIREHLLQLLNVSLGVFSNSTERPSPVICHFGASPLRTDLLLRQNLAAMFERLKQCRELHRQFLQGTTCWNVPAELFAPQQREMKLNSSTTAVASAPSAVAQNGERKRKVAQEEQGEEAGTGGDQQQKQEKKEEEKQEKQEKKPTKSTPKQDSLPTLRRVLEQPPAIVLPPPSPAPSTTTATSGQSSLKERHREVAQLLERPSLIQLHAEEEEKPLNLCLRDGPRK